MLAVALAAAVCQRRWSDNVLEMCMRTQMSQTTIMALHRRVISCNAVAIHRAAMVRLQCVAAAVWQWWAQQWHLSSSGVMSCLTYRVDEASTLRRRSTDTVSLLLSLTRHLLPKAQTCRQRLVPLHYMHVPDLALALHDWPGKLV